MTGVTNPLKLPADYESLRQLGTWLSAVAGEPVPNTIELGVHEVACNVIDHARPPDGVMTLSASRHGDRLHVTLVDGGQAYGGDAEMAEPGTVQERGFGLFIAEAVASELRYERDGEHNRWSLIFELIGQEAKGSNEQGRI